MINYNNRDFQNSKIGKIPQDWTLVTLGSLLYVKGRIGWKGLNKSEFKEKGYLILNGNNIKNNKIYLENIGRISKERFDESPEIILKKNDILMTKDGTIGKIAYVDNLLEPTTIASGLFLIRNKSEILLQKYLWYVFQSHYFRRFIKERVEGSVIPHLYQRDFEEFIISLPNIKEQVKISNILELIDKKIVINSRINSLLESISKLIFKKWFLDFNDIKKKNSENNSELISRYIDILNGCAFKSKDYTEKGIFLLRTKNLKNGLTKRMHDDVFLPKSFLNTHKDYICEMHDYHLIMVGASLGERGMIFHQLPALRNQNMWCFRSKNKNLFSPLLVKFFVDELLKKMIKTASGSAREFFRKEDFKKQTIFFGTETKQKTFSNYSINILKKISNNLLENEILLKTKKILLKKLISGEMRIKSND